MILIPGKSFKGKLPLFSNHEISVATRLKNDVVMLSETIGERNICCRPAALKYAEEFIFDTFNDLGYNLRRETYYVDGVEVANIEAEIVGTRKRDEIVVVGSHYDSAEGTPGANDNATGVAATLELARHFKDLQPERTVRFVGFVNEEPPYFATKNMGSWVYASGAKARKEKIIAMLCLECLGVYSDEVGSQVLTAPLDKLYPNTGNFIAFCSNPSSYPLLRKCIKEFRETTKFPSEGLVAPVVIPVIGWSDHRNFWEFGYPAIMITDTALFRDSHYHLPTDTYQRLNFERMSRVVIGIGHAVENLTM